MDAGLGGGEGWAPLPRGAPCNEGSPNLLRGQQLDVARDGRCGQITFPACSCAIWHTGVASVFASCSPAPCFSGGAGEGEARILVAAQGQEGLGIPATRPRAGGWSRCVGCPGTCLWVPWASAHVLTWGRACGWVAGGTGDMGSLQQVSRGPQEGRLEEESPGGVGP